ncbi:MAG: DnaJ domain-containing protein [Phycisphaerales bacterium]|nr:DnaJ domain-containing protein [Phycisphaerales bacterium]
MDRDPYEVLGVGKDATEDQLRTAYRSAARKYHPDVSTESDAQERFAQVQQAWEILSDPEKKAQYDRFGHVGPGQAHPGQGWGAGSSAGGVHVDAGQFSEIFEEMFGGGAGAGRGRGSRATRGPSPRQGVDQRRDLHVTFLTAARGGVEPVKFDDGSSVQLRIPAGIEDGGVLRLRGRGGPGQAGGPDGDLLVTVRVGAHPLFRREGLDLLVDLPINIAEAVSGVTVEVQLLQGSLELRIPPGTSSGARLRVPGQGIKGQSDRTGDFYAVVQIVAPEVHSEDASMGEVVQEAAERLAEVLPDPRASIDGLETAST